MLKITYPHRLWSVIYFPLIDKGESLGNVNDYLEHFPFDLHHSVGPNHAHVIIAKSQRGVMGVVAVLGSDNTTNAYDKSCQQLAESFIRTPPDGIVI
jgi:hypothetical protein